MRTCWIKSKTGGTLRSSTKIINYLTCAAYFISLAAKLKKNTFWVSDILKKKTYNWSETLVFFIQTLRFYNIFAFSALSFLETSLFLPKLKDICFRQACFKKMRSIIGAAFDDDPIKLGLTPYCAKLFTAYCGSPVQNKHQKQILVWTCTSLWANVLTVKALNDIFSFLL